MENNFLIRYGWVLVLFIFQQKITAQTILEGYTFEQNNRGRLQQVNVTAFQLPENILRAELSTDSLGHFTALLAPGRYRVLSRKDVFFDRQDTVQVGAEKIYLKIEMRRRPGYIFDATLAEARETPDQIVDAIQGANIEIYNRTQRRVEKSLPRYSEAFFQQAFEQGNHYTMLIRKTGFLAKRIEVYVNVKGCILCVDGVRNMSPGVIENLTSGNEMGTLLANIELERARLEKKIEIQNIYYDYDKWDIRPDAAERLDIAVQLMKDNPGLSVELGSHTDCRGNDAYNRVLSQRRAESAVAYIVSEGVQAYRITAKGYGETQLANRCRNGVECSEAEHQQNRRTMLRITGIVNDTAEYRRWPTLEQIVLEEEQAKIVKENRNKQQKATALQPGATLNTSPAAHRTLPEANNSVALPPIQPGGQGAEQQPDAAATGQENDFEMQYVPQALPAKYTGFTVEIARTPKALVAQRDTILQQVSGILMQREKETRQYGYFVGQFKTAAAAKTFLEKDLRVKFPTAKVVEFKNGAIVQ